MSNSKFPLAICFAYGNVYVSIAAFSIRPTLSFPHCVHYTQCSKSERERQILYINACMWNLERRYWWTYLLGSHGDEQTCKLIVVHSFYLCAVPVTGIWFLFWASTSFCFRLDCRMCHPFLWNLVIVSTKDSGFPLPEAQTCACFSQWSLSRCRRSCDLKCAVQVASLSLLSTCLEIPSSRFMPAAASLQPASENEMLGAGLKIDTNWT